jgi:hypothetical protein
VLQYSAKKTLEAVPIPLALLELPRLEIEGLKERPRSLRHDKEYLKLPRYPGFKIKDSN